MYHVVGGNGFLGSYVIKNILENTSEEIIGTARTDMYQFEQENRLSWVTCDVTDFAKTEQMLSKQMEKLKVVYLAAYHHPDEVQKNPKHAWNVNITALSHFINCLENVECFYYISTEMVYGESTNQHLFVEDDSLNPVNLYGVHKKTAEAVVLGYGYNVLRMPFMIGPGITKKHFYDYIVEELAANHTVNMFEDAYKSALDFNTAARIIVLCCEQFNVDMPRIMNISGDDVLSKYQIGKMIAKEYNFPETLIRPLRMASNQRIFTECRAASTLMDNRLVKQVLELEELKIHLEKTLDEKYIGTQERKE